MADSPKPIDAWLARAGAQHDLVEWARGFGSDFAQLWEACPRGDWMLAIAARLAVERRALLSAVLGCTKPALEYVPEAETGAGMAITALERLARGPGETAAAELEAARARLTQAHGAAQDAACAEALLALLAALDAATEPAAGAGAAAFAAHAAMLGAGDCAMLEALRFAQRSQAEAVRAALPTAHLLERWRSAD